MTRLPIIALLLLIAYLLWRILQALESPRNDSGGASPEFVGRVDAQTEDAKKRLQQKQQADLAANRLGR